MVFHYGARVILLAKMRTRFVSRFGETMDIEITVHDPCPECWGGLVPTKAEAGDQSPLRCNSCGMVLKPVKINEGT
jgi:hypothetical protein